MEEKVLWLNLPEDTEYQKVIITGKTRTGNTYLEEYTRQLKDKKTVKLLETVEIPKPKALVGGSEAYHQYNIPYWYCNIKNGRDAFMHVYMEDLTEEDLLYDLKKGKKREFSSNRQNLFKEDVLKALANKPKEGFRWIPVYEPSPTKNGGVQFVSGKKPLLKRSCLKWVEMLERYSPENESGMASKTTYFLLLLRWLKDGFATLEQLAEHSEEIGHYLNMKNPKHDYERTGEREFGGLCGFVGNTGKIVKDLDEESGYSDFGGPYCSYGDEYSLWHHSSVRYPSLKEKWSVGLMELKK